jgi:hypothetical protein
MCYLTGLPGFRFGEGDCLNAGDLGLPDVKEFELPVVPSFIGTDRVFARESKIVQLYKE